MFIMIYLEIILVSYIITFKSDFTEEYLSKAQPFVIVVSILVLMLGTLSSLSRR